LYSYKKYIVAIPTSEVYQQPQLTLLIGNTLRELISFQHPEGHTSLLTKQFVNLFNQTGTSSEQPCRGLPF
jgi:hypothetical protein